jgi:AcrR family transcriptional regulator
MSVSQDRSIDTKQRILDKANELFARHTFDGVSMRTLANEAGVNLAAINYHFENKEGLFLALGKHSFAYMAEATEAMGDPDLAIDELIRGLFKVYMKNGPMLTNFFQLILNSGGELLCRMAEDGDDKMDGPPGTQFLRLAFAREMDLPAEHVHVRTSYESIKATMLHLVIILTGTTEVSRSQLPMKMSQKEAANHLCRLADLLIAGARATV